MSLLLTLAWRNIWRNRRRTAITIAAIAFATLFTAVERGLAVGIWQFNLKHVLELFAGYMQVQRPGYQENPSVSKSFPWPGAAEGALRAEPLVAGYAPRVVADGLLSFRDNSAGVAVVGLDPDLERGTSRFQSRVNAGAFLDRGNRAGVVLGDKLAENLRARVGDTLVLLAQGADGVLADRLVRIVGTLRIGSPEVDATTMLMTLSAAQEMLAMDGRANVVAVAVSDIRDLPRALRGVRQALASAGAGLAVLPWQEVLPDFKQAMDFDSVNDWVFLGVLIVIVSFGILNTVTMSVTERFREFGVTLSLGMPPVRLAGQVVLETIYVAAIGIALGVAGGYALVSYFARHPVLITGKFGAIYESYGFIPQLVTSADPGILLRAALLILAVALLSSCYPAFRVYHLEPLKGIRYT